MLITCMIGNIRLQIMKSRANMAKQCKSWENMLVPMMHEHLQNALDKGRTWQISSSSTSFFEVHCESSMFVNIGQRICKCGKWQVHGFPFPHAEAVLTKSSHMSGKGIIDAIIYNTL